MVPLSASEYLKHRQSLASSQSGLRSGIPHDELDAKAAPLMGGIDMTSGNAAHQEETYKRLREGETDALSTHSKMLLSSLSPDTSKLLWSIPVGTLPVMEFNAMTIKSPCGDPIVVIDTGMMAIITQIVTEYVASMPLPNSPAELSFQQASQRVFNWTLFQLTKSEKWRPTRLEVQAPERKQIIGGIFANALNFILGHEYGHILLGHGERERPLCGSIGNSPQMDVLKIYQRTHEEEYAADHKGAEMAIEFSRNIHQGWIGAGVWGVEFVLQIIRLGEVFTTQIENQPYYPLATKRLSAFHGDDWGPDFNELISRIVGFFDASVTTIELLLKKPDVRTQLLGEIEATRTVLNGSVG